MSSRYPRGDPRADLRAVPRKVIRLTEGHRAKVEEKPEVRKAGGVFYTPTYIVDYIVRQTVGEVVQGKTPKEVSAITILDPAAVRVLSCLGPTSSC